MAAGKAADGPSKPTELTFVGGGVDGREEDGSNCGEFSETLGQREIHILNN